MVNTRWWSALNITLVNCLRDLTVPFDAPRSEIRREVDFLNRAGRRWWTVCAAGSGVDWKTGEETESRLFGELEEGVSLAVDDVGRVMRAEVLAEVERWFGREVAALRAAGPLMGPLTALVDEEEQRVKAALGNAVDAARVTALGEFVPARLR